MIFALAGRAMLTDQTDVFTRQMLVAHVADALGRAVCHADAKGGKTRGQPAFRAASPTHLLPGLLCQHLLCGNGLTVGDVVLSGAPMPRNREDHGNISGVHLLSSGDANCPEQAALAQRLAERPTHRAVEYVGAGIALATQSANGSIERIEQRLLRRRPLAQLRSIEQTTETVASDPFQLNKPGYGRSAGPTGITTTDIRSLTHSSYTGSTFRILKWGEG